MMKMRFHFKKVFAGIFIGFISRIIFKEFEKTRNQNAKFNCMHCDEKKCPPCLPTKIHINNELNMHLPPAYKPKGMYEVTRWLLVDENFVYDIINEEPKIELKGALKKAIQEITSISLEYINLNRMMGKTWSLLQFQNGYVRTDSKRGTDYILDLKVAATEKNLTLPKSQQVFRVHLVHPFRSKQNFQLISIKDNLTAKVSIIIPIQQISPFIKNLIDDFESNVKESKIQLILVLFGDTKNFIPNSLYNSILEMAHSKPNQITILKENGAYGYHSGIKKGIMAAHPNDIILTIKEGYSFTKEIFDHCRAICSEGQRVYFPVPFAQFNSEITESGMPPGKVKNVNKKDHTKFTGQWAHQIHDSICGFKSDLLKVYDDNDILSQQHIYEKFLLKNYETFMAVEPNLFKLNDLSKCQTLKNTIELTKCHKTASQYLGSKPALGILYINEVLSKTL